MNILDKFIKKMTEDKNQEQEALENPTDLKEINLEGVKETNDLLESLKIEVAEQKDKYLRLFAEFDNYKKRTSKERIELIKTASQEMIIELLPIIDDFERAKKLSEEQSNEQIFPEGMQFMFSKLNTILKNKGVIPMETNGQNFDPNFHEAITEISCVDEEQKGKIFDTIEKGYFLHDKIIRYAKVIVNK